MSNNRRGFLRDGLLCLPAASLEISVDQLLAIAQADGEDSVFACGSLVEGIGNGYSDIDIYVITKLAVVGERALALRGSWRSISSSRKILSSTENSRYDDPIFLVHVPLKEMPTKVDIEYRTRSEVAVVRAAIGSIYEYAVNNLELLTVSMDLRDRMIVHRLSCGINISSPLDVSFCRSDLEKFTYLLYRWVASDFSVLIDCLGAWQAGEMSRSALIIRDKMAQEMMGLMNLAGLTTQHVKWLLSYLTPDSKFCSLSSNTDIKKLAPTFIALYAEVDWSSKAYATYVLECADHIDRIYDAVTIRLAMSPFPSGEEARHALRKSIRISKETEYAGLELEHRLLPYGERSRPLREMFSMKAHQVL